MADESSAPAQNLRDVSEGESERGIFCHVRGRTNQRRYRSHLTAGDVEKLAFSLREGDRRDFGFSRGGDWFTSSGGRFRTR
ncbi:hypothetical protein AVEN_271033-1 [Araneus ventricosus]|uniref:Uncharacterized protein n=1 Tax=Araneus ventricosus TaxID=182803 RepID=A0A4Y2FF42_ARAVE|nr:hypothetical protein AVEN_271033-1 [Araneus ventricosus]